MDWFRIRHTIGLCLKGSGQARANYIRKHDLFRSVGKHCMFMPRKIPLYPKLISFGNNVWVASDVLLVPHDAIHHMLNYCVKDGDFQENVGCIDIKDNVFIGSNSTILPDVTIGPNTIIAAGSLVNKSIPGNGVYGGVPCKYICSFDEFIKKRASLPKVELKKMKGGLTPDSVEGVWRRFQEKEGKLNE